MPEEDGYSLMKRVRRRSVERGGAVPAIALTALAEHRDRIAALAAGYQIHLAKPVNLQQLLLAAAALAPAPAGRGGSGRMGRRDLGQADRPARHSAHASRQ